ncbi:MAG: hypothetical protein NTX50_25975 [Candidatus Sumerlaeota bacterium]|nr:hypothetical protein [Candidatus Sumerlaeota bacterium]
MKPLNRFSGPAFSRRQRHDSIQPAMLFLPLALAVSLPLASGCIGLTKEYPRKQYYLVEAQPPAPKTPAAGVSGILSVRRLRVSPGFDSKGFVYQTGQADYCSDFYHEFFIPPADMLTEQTRQWLDQSKLFSCVLFAPGAVEDTHILEGAVVAIYGDYRDKRSPKAVLEMQFLFLRDAPQAPVIFWQKNYRQEVPLARSSPEALVDGWREALRAILSSLENDMRQTRLAEAAARK